MMSEFEKYLYSNYETRRESIGNDVIRLDEMKEACNMLNEMMGIKEYRDLMGVFETDKDGYAFEGYKKGFGDGMRFLMNMVTK